MMERTYSILIADDDAAAAAHFAALLTEAGLLVEVVHSVEEARLKLFHTEIDLTVLDVRMEDGAGLNILKVVYDEGIGSRVVILTDAMDSETLIKALNYRADYWFHKSGVDEAAFVAKVRELAEGISLDEVRRILSALPKEI